MTSMNINMEEHLDEQPPAKKARIGDSIGQRQQGSDEPNGMNSDADADEQKQVTETSTTTMDLPRHRKLPAELNSQIFLCFNPATQRKFICGLGWDFYAMFRRRLHTKTMKVRNPNVNRWNRTNTRATVEANGLGVYISNQVGDSNVLAEQPFLISGPQCRVDEFPGTICYYYEVRADLCEVGLSDGAIHDNLRIGDYPNSYALHAHLITHLYYYECWLAGEAQDNPFELRDQQRRERSTANVYGCGVVLDPEDKLAIFFTLNGKLMGPKIPISPSVDRLFPTVQLSNNAAIVANFGDNPAKPFKYDIKHCPGLELGCI